MAFLIDEAEPLHFDVSVNVRPWRARGYAQRGNFDIHDTVAWTRHIRGMFRKVHGEPSAVLAVLRIATGVDGTSMTIRVGSNAEEAFMQEILGGDGGGVFRLGVVDASSMSDRVAIAVECFAALAAADKGWEWGPDVVIVLDVGGRQNARSVQVNHSPETLPPLVAQCWELRITNADGDAKGIVASIASVAFTDVGRHFFGASVPTHAVLVTNAPGSGPVKDMWGSTFHSCHIAKSLPHMAMESSSVAVATSRDFFAPFCSVRSPAPKPAMSRKVALLDVRYIVKGEQWKAAIQRATESMEGFHEALLFDASIRGAPTSSLTSVKTALMEWWPQAKIEFRISETDQVLNSTQLFQREVDAHLIVEIFRAAQGATHMLLFAGDGDFIPAMETVRNVCPRLRIFVAAYQKSMNASWKSTKVQLRLL